MRLTVTSIRGLACPAGKTEYTYFDDDLPGFGLRTRPGGSSSWLFQYAVAGRTRKMFLGGPSVVDPGQARDAARDLAAQVRLGRDPAREKSENRAKAKDTFVGLLPRFLERQRERARAGSYSNIERHMTKDAQPLHSTPVTALTRRVVGDFWTRSPGPGAITPRPASANRSPRISTGSFVGA